MGALPEPSPRAEIKQALRCISEGLDKVRETTGYCAEYDAYLYQKLPEDGYYEMRDVFHTIEVFAETVINSVNCAWEAVEKMEGETKEIQVMKVQKPVKDKDPEDIKPSGAELGSRSRRRRLRFKRIQSKLQTQKQQ